MSANLNTNQDNMTEYSAHSIKVLKGLEAVRTRPGMYIGDTDDGSGLHHMVYEVVDNAIDEALAGHCDDVYVAINADGSVTVRDNGRGVPVDIHEEEGISAAEVIMTQLHAGGKFDSNSYKVSGGLHGVGVSVVNALSVWLELVIYRNDKKHYVRFKDGVAEEPLKVVGDAEGKKGTEVTFMPSDEIFTGIVFNYVTLEHRLRELSFLNSGVKIILEDLREDPKKEIVFCYEGGISAFAKYLDKSKHIIHESIAINGEGNDIVVDAAMQWNDSYHENTYCFTNNIRQREGGAHLAGFRAALTRTINNYANNSGAFKKQKVALSAEDMREGMTCVLSVKVPDPKFSSQTKDKLVSSEVRPIVESVVSEKLAKWLEEHPNEAKQIVTKIVEAGIAREAARKARDLTRKKTGFEISTLPGKLASCQSKRPEECELFLVEGDSAGGSAKQGRDRAIQAILPLKGKILNVERARFDKMLSSAEVGTLITALGTGIGDQEFNIEKLRYHKIVIMTDADVDGAHIRTLLLTFFYRYMPDLISKGYLYIAQPPLYKVKRGQSEVYLKDQQALSDHLLDAITENTQLTAGDGSTHAGIDLRNICVDINDFVKLILENSKVVNTNILEIAAFNGLFHHIDGDIDLELIATNMVNNLSASEKVEKVHWSYNIKDKDICLIRKERGVETLFSVGQHSIPYREAKAIQEKADSIKNIFQSQITLERKGVEIKCNGAVEFIEQLFATTKKGLYIQRFKGLGEMNAEQLWDTTLNPETRTLLQVKVDNTDEAEEVFSTLMGDIVEPRREFIQSNALKVNNIDA